MFSGVLLLARESIEEDEIRLVATGAAHCFSITLSALRTYPYTHQRTSAPRRFLLQKEEQSDTFERPRLSVAFC